MPPYEVHCSTHYSKIKKHFLRDAQEYGLKELKKGLKTPREVLWWIENDFDYYKHQSTANNGYPVSTYEMIIQIGGNLFRLVNYPPELVKGRDEVERIAFRS